MRYDRESFLFLSTCCSRLQALADTSPSTSLANHNVPRLLLSFRPLLFCLCCVLGAAHAQTALPEQARNPPCSVTTLADSPSLLYRFERHELTSLDGRRHYRIEISIPRAPAPQTGYPVLYMLDGNAAMDTLTADDLALLSRGEPPVLVAIGYDTPQRNDVVARSYDYTPPVDSNGEPPVTPAVRGREGGGAGIFLRFITERIKPLVRTRVPLDADKEYLWGHSYGGLFTLYTLFTQPDAFARYIAGDPSVWWHDGALMQHWHAFPAERAAGKRIALLVGTKPRDTARPMPNVPSAYKGGPPVDQRTATRDMAEAMRRSGADVSYDTFPQHGHGAMIRVSLERALQIASEP